MRCDQREHLLDQQRRQAERRLVEDQQLRLGHQAAADGEHLLLAARQRAGALRAALVQARKDVEHARRGSARGARRRGDSCRDRDSRAPSGWGRSAALPARGSARARRWLRGFSCSIAAPSKRIEPARARTMPEMRAIERRLADAVGAEHGDDLAGARRRDRCRAALRFRRSRRAGPSMSSSASVAMRRSQLCRRAVAEIGLDDGGIGRDLRRRALGDDAAFRQHEDVLAPGSSPPASRARSSGW